MADVSSKLDEQKEQLSTALPFSNSEKDVIDRRLNVASAKTASLDKINDVYEIEKTVEIVLKNSYQNVALQFPDALLSDSSTVASLLEKQTSAKIFVLADTSYGSCCVDEVAAEHIKADAIIHYGRACLSLTRRLPVYYVFGKEDINITNCHQQLITVLPDRSSRIIVMYDVVYSHCIEKLEKELQGDYKNLVVSKLEPTLLNKVINQSNNSRIIKYNREEKESLAEYGNKERKNGKKGIKDEKKDKSTNEPIDKLQSVDESAKTKYWIRRFGYEFCLPSDHKIQEYKVFYIGQQSLNLTNFMMTYNKCQFYSYDPVTDTAKLETLNVNKVLMKRYYLIQKAKDAQVVGIVVGTLGVMDYLEIIERLKKVLVMAGKKFYTFVVGKLNVPKMANFMEIDIFVLVACPENTLIDSQEFYKPIVTPYEMEIACLRTQEWTGDYVTDFRQLLPGASYSVDLNHKDNIIDEDDVPDMSLITGQLRPNYKAMANTTDTNTTTSVVERNQDTTISTQRHTTGAEFLASRSWKGLEQNLGETAVTQAKEGRMGIASCYTHETGQ